MLNSSYILFELSSDCPSESSGYGCGDIFSDNASYVILLKCN